MNFIEAAPVNLTLVDWIVVLIYFAFVLGIGFLRRTNASTDFFPGRTRHSRVCGWRYLRQSGRAGSHRPGSLGCEIRHCDQLLLLDGRDPGYGLRWTLHDALSVFTGDSLTLLVGGLALEDLGVRCRQALPCPKP